MLEAVLAGAIFGALALIGGVSQHHGWFGLLQIGCAVVGAGAVLSFVTGAMYHLRLSQTHACRTGCVRQWWWAPTQLHRFLTDTERRRVLPWFWAGATSFGLVLLGAVWVVLAVSRMHA